MGFLIGGKAKEEIGPEMDGVLVKKGPFGENSPDT